MVKTITKIGNSQGVIFDAALLDLTGLRAGDQVAVSVAAGGSIILTPIRKAARPEEVTAATADDCIHLTVDIVKEIHKAVIDEFGGLRGVRDEGLLASAVGAPQASFGGKSPYAD